MKYLHHSNVGLTMKIFFILERNKRKNAKEEKHNPWKKGGKPPETAVWWLAPTFTEVAVYFPLVAIQHRAPRVTLHSVRWFKQEFKLRKP